MAGTAWLTVTAFTVAHSLTLAAATFGFVSVPGPPIEAAIALSIVLVAVEIVNARRGMPSLAARWPWLIAFCFGLLHGFGFAGALAEVGLPHHAIPVALLFFNVGVEFGQLAFVAAVLTAARFSAAYQVSPYASPAAPNVNRLDVMAAYAIGTVAAFWLIERTSAFFSVKLFATLSLMSAIGGLNVCFLRVKRRLLHLQYPLMTQSGLETRRA